MGDFKRIKRAVAEVARSRGALRAVVFGSYARGTETRHSDLDVLVVEDTSRRFIDRIGRYFDPLTERLEMAIEVLVYTPEELEQIKHRPFIQTALEEGIVVYESGKIPERGETLAATGEE